MLKTHGRHDYSALPSRPDYFRTKHGPILSVPYARDLNDSFECVSRRTPSQDWCDNLRDLVWLARPREICAHVESLPPGTVPG